MKNFPRELPHGSGAVMLLDPLRLLLAFRQQQPGSSFECPPTRRAGNVSVRGGELIIRDGKRFVEVRQETAVVRLEKVPHQLYPLSLHVAVPPDAAPGTTYQLSASQRNAQGETVGGASVVYRVR